MRFSSTPFFSALGPLLFGRPPCSELKKLQAQAQGTDSISELRKALGQFVPDALFGQPKKGAQRLTLLRWSLLLGVSFSSAQPGGSPVATPCVKHRLGGRWDAGGRSLRTPVPIVRREPASVKRRWKLFIARPHSDWNAMCPAIVYGSDAELKSSMAPAARCPIRQKIRRPTHSQGVKSQGAAFRS